MKALHEALPGNLRICPKLTKNHVNPTNMMKIKVKLATQVLLQQNLYSDTY